MNARRRGIIIRMPRMPPRTETVITRTGSISNPSSKSAGIVTPTPNAIDSPALPVVWTMLFSRMVALRTPNAFEKARNRVIESTAIGTEAETVSPTLRTRYSDDAPNRMPSSAPVRTVGQVNSGGDSVGGTNGWWAGGAAGSGAGVSAMSRLSRGWVRRDEAQLTAGAREV